jgi:hypothetical protein
MQYMLFSDLNKGKYSFASTNGRVPCREPPGKRVDILVCAAFPRGIGMSKEAFGAKSSGYFLMMCIFCSIV